MSDVNSAFNWVPADWARPDKYRYYPVYYLWIVLALIFALAGFFMLIPAVVVVAGGLVLAVIGIVVAVVAVVIPFVLIFVGAIITPRLVGTDKYEYLQEKYGDQQETEVSEAEM